MRGDDTDFHSQATDTVKRLNYEAAENAVAIASKQESNPW